MCVCEPIQYLHFTRLQLIQNYLRQTRQNLKRAVSNLVFYAQSTSEVISGRVKKTKANRSELGKNKQVTQHKTVSGYRMMLKSTPDPREP